MADDLPGAWTSRGFHRAHLFPVEGDSAVAELWHDDEIWAEVRLEGLRLNASGEDRITSATAMVRLFALPAGAAPGRRDYHLDDILAELSAAQEWLLDNERGRSPVDSADRLSRAGRALSTASAAMIDRLHDSVPPASNPEPPDAGTGDLTIVLIDEGPTPIKLIRELRRLTGCGLMDARALVESRPSVVMTGLSATEAASVRQSLQAAGAIAEIR
jgi:ribosomal protein L7/L12